MNNTLKIIITAGFAMFSMFFGSGNLVYPLAVGTESLDKFLSAAVGLITTGVFVPFLGLIAIILYRGNRRAFFQTIGTFPAIILTLVVLGLLGPIGVVPRCILVSYGSIQNIFPEAHFLIPFAIGFTFITSIMIWQHHQVVPVLGRFLTPLLLLGIITVIITGLYSAPQLEITSIHSENTFWDAFRTGYQTMDLLAAFFFSATIVEYLQSHHHIQRNPSKLLGVCSASSLIAAGLLTLIYGGFVALGAHYGPELSTISPEQMLTAIAKHAIGPAALPLVAATATLACLTTATVLSMQFAEFISEEVTQGKLKRHPAIILTLGASFFMSLKGFGSLTAFLGTVLTMVYPGLIALTVANIAIKLFPALPKKLPGLAFYITLGVNLVM